MKQIDTITELLRHVPLCHALDQARLAQVADACELLKFARNEMIFDRGAPVNGLYYMVSGCVKLYAMSKDGVEKVVHLATPGEAFGEAAMFLDAPAPVATQAVQDSVVLVLPKSVLYKLIEADPQVAHQMLAGMSMRMHRLIQDIKAVGLKSATERVIGYLLQLCCDQTEVQNIVLPAKKSTIASLLNLTPETLSRILTKLEQQGLIFVNATEIRIPDCDRLRGDTLA